MLQQIYVPEILYLKSSSEQIFSKICRWAPLTLNRFLFVSNTVEALLTDTLKGGRLYLRPPSQNPVFLNFHTNSVFLRYRKRSAQVTDTHFASWGCTQVTTASTVMPSFHIVRKSILRSGAFSNLAVFIGPTLKEIHHSKTTEFTKKYIYI